VSYTEPTTQDFFNIQFHGDLELHNRVMHHFVTHPKFHRYEVLKLVMQQGEFRMHEPGMRQALEEIASEYQSIWLEIHNSLRKLAESL
jgi:hypothetical protein